MRQTFQKSGTCGLFTVALAVGGCSPPMPLSDYDLHCLPSAPANTTLATRTVRGTQHVTGILNGAAVDKPQDLTSAQLQALVPTGSGFIELPGYGTATGDFCVPNVPAGGYWLTMKTPLGSVPQWYFLTSDSADLGYENPDRSDDWLKTTGTKLALNLTGLTSCAGEDNLVSFVPTLPDYAPFFAYRPAGQSSATFSDEHDLDGVSPLVDSAQGDRLYIHQYCDDANQPGVNLITSSGLLPPFSMAQGVTTTVSGQLSPVATDQTLKATAQLASFAAYESALVGSGAPPQGSEGSVTISAKPFGKSPGLGTDEAATVAQINYAGLAARQDQLLNLHYGNPFPTDWPLIYNAAFVTEVMRTAPGAASPTLFPAVIQTTQESPIPTALAPLLGPIRALTVNGRDGWQDQTTVGLSPTLGWNAPALGTAAGYDVVMIRLAVGNSVNPPPYLRAFIRTAERSIIIPPGILEHGSAYVFMITSRSRITAPQAPTPLGPQLVTGSATTVSGVMQVD